MPRRRFSFRNGIGGVIAVSEDKAEKEFKLADLYLDIGAKDAARGQDYGVCGRYGSVLRSDFGEWYPGNRAVSRQSSRRAALLQAMRMLQRPMNDLYVVFTVQEEVGLRGAKPVAWSLEPDYALIVDVTCPDDVPGALHEGTTALGKGAAIKVMDHSVIAHPAVVEQLSQLASERGFRFSVTC